MDVMFKYFLLLQVSGKSTLTFNELKLDGNVATAKIYELLTFRYYDKTEGCLFEHDSSEGVNYTLELVKENNKWMVLNVEPELKEYQQLKDETLSVDSFVNATITAGSNTNAISAEPFGVDPEIYHINRTNNHSLDVTKVCNYA